MRCPGRRAGTSQVRPRASGTRRGIGAGERHDDRAGLGEQGARRGLDGRYRSRLPLALSGTNLGL